MIGAYICHAIATVCKKRGVDGVEQGTGKIALARPVAVCYSSPPRKTQHLMQSEKTGSKKKVVDEISEVLHTLPSLQMTNKTICR
jgi:hypothetical protein